MLSYFLRLAWQHIWQTPVLSSLILFAIALGIGVSMTMVSYYKAMAHNPAGARSDQLYSVQLSAYGDDMSSWGQADGLPLQVTHQDAMNLRAADLGFKQSPFFRINPVVESRVEGRAPASGYIAMLVDQPFFSMFDIQFIYGAPWDKQIDQNGARQVVITERLNNWLFGGGNSIGKSFVMLDGESEFTVVGVVTDWNPQPAYYDLTSGIFPRKGPGMFLPYALTAELKEYPHGSISAWKNEEVNNFEDFLKSEYVWQRYWVELHSAADREKYQAFLAAYAEEQQQLGRFQNPNPRGQLRDVAEWLSYNRVIDEDNRVMVGLSLLFLLVCLVNTIGLLLAKFLKKLNEAGVRRALGASRWQIFLQYQVEVGLLGFLGGLLGLLFCAIGLFGVRELYDTQIARLDFLLVLGALALSLVSVLITGLFPAYRVCSAQPSLFLKAQ